MKTQETNLTQITKMFFTSDWKEKCMEMRENVIGITDDGMPIVLPQHCCEYWEAGKIPMLGSRECWYCRFADFRKSIDMTLAQSVCRCPQNRVAVSTGGKNEELPSENNKNKRI